MKLRLFAVTDPGKLGNRPQEPPAFQRLVKPADAQRMVSRKSARYAVIRWDQDDRNPPLFLRSITPDQANAPRYQLAPDEEIILVGQQMYSDHESQECHALRRDAVMSSLLRLDWCERPDSHDDMTHYCRTGHARSMAVLVAAHQAAGGSQARRNALRSEVRATAGGRADSTNPRYWPAPHWTHNMAADAAAANARRWATAQHGEYIPPPHEPVTEAWAELEAQREAETRHRLDLARAREQMRRAEDQAALGVRRRRGASCAWPRRDATVPPQEWGDTRRAAARAAVRGVRISPPQPGATRPLGPRAAAPPQPSRAG